jgi:general secretion pathway protein M
MLDRLSEREQRTVAIGLLALSLITVYFALVEPVILAYQDYDERLTQLQDRVASYQRMAGQGEMLQRQLTQIKKQAGKEQVGYFKGSTHAIAAAKMQDYVKQLIEGNGGRLNSIQVLPGGEGRGDKEKESEPPSVTIRVQMSGGTETVQKVLYALESSQPRVFVDNLYLHGRGSYQYLPGKASSDQLDIRFHLTGFIQPVGA